ncbi:MAG: helix-turn-helix domain-containing protein [Armatimonadota bacterium]|nr:helix-turn-helix domain-containing protein [Armatimonadota bacterium]
MATFGALISERRKAMGLSQKELAAKVRKEDRSAISPQYLNDLEHDRRGAPSDQLIDEFAEVLGIDKDALYYSAGEVSPDLRGLNPENENVRNAIAAFRRNLEKENGE